MSRVSFLGLAVVLPVSVLALASQHVIIPTDEASLTRTTPVAPDLFSFSIEQDRWLDWVGHKERNLFFYNALANLKELALVPPRIRVGGRSQDVTFHSFSMQDTEVLFANASSSVPYPEATLMRVGPSFYAAARFLPENTRVVHGLNFASTDDLRGLLQLTGIVNAFLNLKKSGIVLDGIEIGNEPDVYSTMSRPPGYDSSAYIRDWKTWAGNVLGVENWYPEYRVTYWAPSVSHLSRNSSEWSPTALLDQGLLVSDAGRRVTTISQHHYSGDACVAFRGDIKSLTSKANIRASLDALRPDIRATFENELEYVLGEAGSYTCHGAVGVSDTAAASLWALDYALYAATLGVARIYFHQGIGYRSNFIQPVILTRSPTDGSELPSPLEPHVNPQYYAAVVAAEAFGAQGSIRVLELPVKDKRVSAYAFYQSGIPTRALFINNQPYYPPPEGAFQARPAVRVTLELEGISKNSSQILKRLSIPYSDSMSGMTWGGVTYETKDGRAEGEEEVECIAYGDAFDINATEAVLVYLQDVEESETA